MLHIQAEKDKADIIIFLCSVNLNYLTQWFCQFLMEKICNTFLKLLLPVRKATPSYLLYGELGRYPVHISVKLRLIAFWFRLLVNSPSYHY